MGKEDRKPPMAVTLEHSHLTVVIDRYHEDSVWFRLYDRDQTWEPPRLLMSDILQDEELTQLRDFLGTATRHFGILSALERADGKATD